MPIVKYIYSIVVASVVCFSSFVVADEILSQTDFDCVIVPSNTADLGSNDRGVIAKIAVDRNDFVKKGEVIATLDDTLQQATVALAKKQAENIAEIKLQQVNLTYAKREEERAHQAYKEKAFSLHDFDKAKVTTQLAEIQLLQAEEQQVLAQNKLKQAEAQLAYRTIYAPFNGVVMERFKTIGEYIDDDPVVRLAQLDPLYAELIVPVTQKNEIKVGMHARVCTDKNDGLGWDVSVIQVDEVIDAASGTFGVRLLLPNPEYKIPAGLRCNLKFMEGETSSHG